MPSQGTPQPTTVDGLKLYLDEVGWQVDTTGLPGYNGRENVAVTDEETQADVYRKLVTLAQCDPDIAEVNVFGFIDDPLRTGFQAALHRADGSPRPAAAAVKDAIGLACYLPPGSWQPTRGVVGASRPTITEAGDKLVVELAAKEGATARVCLFSGSHDTASATRLLVERGDHRVRPCSRAPRRSDGRHAPAGNGRGHRGRAACGRGESGSPHGRHARPSLAARLSSGSESPSRRAS